MYYDVCLDSGWGYGPLRTANVFVRDQGITKLVTRGLPKRDDEYIWVQLDNSVFLSGDVLFFVQLVI